MKSLPSVLFVLALLLTATGCDARGDGGLQGRGPSTGPGASEGSAPLWGSTFLLTSARTDGEPMAIVANTEISLRFTEDHLIHVTGGCNAMSGPVTVENGRLSVVALSSTLMGCDEPRQAQDEWLADFLEGDPSFELTGATLTLRGGDKEMVLTKRSTAEPGRPLEGTLWTVDTLLDGQGASSIPVGTPPPTLEFGPEEVKVFAGCNSGSANYRLSGEKITFDLLALTDMACGGKLALQSAVGAVLDGPVSYDVTSTVLTLNHPSGKGLRLRAS
jgi:heat shock protein HslJ